MSPAPPPTVPAGGHHPAAGPGTSTEVVLDRARDIVAAPTLDDVALRRWLHGLPGVDEVGADGRAAALSTRSIKASAKQWALDLAVRMVDLTTLEGADTPGTVRTLCAKGRRPDPDEVDGPRVAAVCVYGDLVGVAREALAGTGIKVAAVATAFPSGRASRGVKLAEVRDVVAAGADEVDMVIDRGAFLSGRYGEVFSQIVAVREVCQEAVGPFGRPAHLKVILETGELAGYDAVRRAAWLALLAGADFVKTSTGKVSPAATLPVTLILLRAVRDWYALTDEVVGVKPAGGIRTAKDALRYLVAVHETAGPDWLSPDRFRFGASSLLNDLLRQRRRQRTGAYAGAHHLTLS